MKLHELINEKVDSQIKDINYHENLIYDDEVIFHCYWNKGIEINQLFSILSCYLINVKDTNNKIILWHDFDIKKYIETPIYNLLSRFCEVKHFDYLSERVGTPLESHQINRNEYLSLPAFWSDYLRLIMLYKYEGMWFDLDVFFFKKFDYLFSTYDSFLPTWEKCKHPNNVIFWCKDKEIIKSLIERFIKYGGGHFGFQDTFSTRGENQNNFNLDSDHNLNILPCAWFDAMFLEEESDLSKWFKNNNNEYFYDDTYCYHWHNRNHLPIEKGSPFHRNIVKVIEELGLQDTIKI